MLWSSVWVNLGDRFVPDSIIASSIMFGPESDVHWGWFLSGTEMVHSVVTCSWGLELRQAWPRPVFSITRICWLMDAIIIHTMPLIITHTTASDACMCCDIVHVIVVLTGLCCQDLWWYVNMNSVSPLSSQVLQIVVNTYPPASMRLGLHDSNTQDLV